MKMFPWLMAIALTLSLNTAQAGVIIGGTRVIYPGGKKEASLNVKNPDKHSYLIQSWIDNEGNEKAPFIITPPLFRLGATEDNALRIVRTGGQLPEDRESMFWMNIKTIPATEKQENVNTLQIAIKTRLKLIYRPQSLTAAPETQANKLSWQRNGQRLIVNNPTPYYMNFSVVNVGHSMVKDATYVAPMSTATFTLPANATGDVSWKIISDFGAAGKEYRAHL
ncbi:fimbrial biogenesis chaperone [Pseudocitrobacter cyperus]|uniref:Fimbria/pilus periplasmic chaperone n=1 Tax=Pseudocitrobacter cyperus TaxID=3112843 RepID=A0ABV0HFF9_9ENTR